MTELHKDYVFNKLYLPPQELSNKINNIDDQIYQYYLDISSFLNESLFPYSKNKMYSEFDKIYKQLNETIKQELDEIEIYIRTKYNIEDIL